MCFNEVCIEQSARSNITLALCHSLQFIEILKSYTALHIQHTMSTLISKIIFYFYILTLALHVFVNVLINYMDGIKSENNGMVLLYAPCYPEFILLH